VDGVAGEVAVVERAGIEGSIGIGSADAIEPEYRLALLREWHCALTSIVAADPETPETRRTIDTIEGEIAKLEIICKKNRSSAEPKIGSNVIGS
jgi:hypothetical protein